MDTREHHLDPAQSLEVIAAVIAQTKENIKGYSFLYLLWGWLIAIASFSFFFLHHYTSFKYFFLPFPLLAVTGIVISLWRHSTMRHQSETYIASYLKKLWLVLGISFALVIFINVVETATPFTYTLLIGGIGTLVSGLVLRFKPLVSGGVLFLLFSVISVFTPDYYKPLLQGIAVITGYLVPGYLLKYSRT
ncbi:hypothetical protein [Chitinophaga sp. RAB17]|uniref:hypothetical protein n=1 Tax=Chitinophaga sp. RAB17 TaxID=3233049 RepID=UPI003F93324F